MTVVATGDPAVFAHRCEWRGGMAVALHNLSREPRTVTLQFDEADVPHLVDVFGDRAYEPIRCGTAELRMEAYGYRWLRVDSLTRVACTDVSRKSIEVPRRSTPPACTRPEVPRHVHNA